MVKLICYLFIFSLIIPFHAKAQLTDRQEKALGLIQDSLNRIGNEMNTSPDLEQRQNASGVFISTLVKALNTPYSYNFPFDSLKGVSILHDQENTFRIFSWGVPVYDNYYRFFGAIQKNTVKGNLELFPFFDATPFIKDKDTITDNKTWPGAAYYNMVETEKEGHKFYTLIGWRGYTFDTNSKLLEVLTFHNNKPVFGAPVFNFEKDSTHQGIKNRFILTYKRDGNLGLNYDRDLNLIIYDHLASLKGDPADSTSLAPDGTYSGFKWENGYWMHVDKIFNFESREAPLPQPLKPERKIEGNKNK